MLPAFVLLKHLTFISKTLTVIICRSSSEEAKTSKTAILFFHPIALILFANIGNFTVLQDLTFFKVRLPPGQWPAKVYKRPSIKRCLLPVLRRMPVFTLCATVLLPTCMKQVLLCSPFKYYSAILIFTLPVFILIFPVSISKG